jgi:hypothetical protein
LVKQQFDCTGISFFEIVQFALHFFEDYVQAMTVPFGFHGYAGFDNLVYYLEQVVPQHCNRYWTRLPTSSQKWSLEDYVHDSIDVLYSFKWKVK